MADTIPARAEATGRGAGVHIVDVHGAVRHYGLVRAVDGVDLTICRGEFFGLIGRNGAGKTTLFRMMLGLTPLTGGQILLDGAPVDGRGFREVRRRIGYLPENVVFHGNLSGLETLQFFARLKSAPAEDCARLLERVGLASAASRRTREYSRGMRQRLGLAQALLGQPHLLFLDEPTTGLDPEGVRQFYAILRELSERGVTIVLTSHILAEVQERVDRLAIMSCGRVRATGSVEALRSEMDLPVWVDVRLAPQDVAAVRAAVARLPLMAVEDGEDGLALQCSRQLKMRVLETLSGFGGAVRDIRIREPTLEDLFFGYSD